MSTPSRFARWRIPILNHRLGYTVPDEPDPDPEDPIDYAHQDQAGAVQVAISTEVAGELLTGETVTSDASVGITPPANPTNANDRDYETNSVRASGVFAGSYAWTVDFGSPVEVTSMAVDEAVTPVGSSPGWEDPTALTFTEFSDDGSTYTPSTYTYATSTVPTGLFFPEPTTTTRHTYTLDTPSTHRYWRIRKTYGMGFHVADGMAEWFIYGTLVSGEEWTAAAAANDGDDATYAEWSALIDDAFAQVALEVPRLIYRAEALVAYAAAGSKTIELYGSTDAVFTTPVLLDSVTFTATGSNTPDDVTFAWVPTASYQFFRLQGVNDEGRLHTISMFSVFDASPVTEHEELTGRDEADQHPATAVTVADSAGWFTATNVETVIAELAAKAIGYQAHGNLGTTETFSAATGWHSGTLNANCTFTLTGSLTTTASSLFLELAQDGTGGWTITLPASVVNKTELEADQDTTASQTTFLALISRDGGTTWYGGWWGSGGGGSDLTIEDEGTPLATAATTLDFVGAGVTASGATADKTITIPGGATASDTGIWRPLMDSGTGMVIVDGATGEATMGFGPA